MRRTDKYLPIIAALKSNPNAAEVARQLGGVSRWTVRRLAKIADIELSASMATKGHHRVSTEKRSQIIAALKSNPNAAEVSREIGGVSRMTVWKIAKAIGIK